MGQTGHQGLHFCFISHSVIDVSTMILFHPLLLHFIMRYQVAGNISSNQKYHVVVGIGRCQRPAGLVPSSMLGLESLTGELDEFGFEDFLNGKFLLKLVSCIVPTAWIGISS